MSTLLTVTMVLAVLIGIILAALTFGVWLLTKVRPNPFARLARSSYIFLDLCAGVAYCGLTLVWLVSALVYIVVREPGLAVISLLCAVIGGGGGTYLLRTAYRRSVLPHRRYTAARAAWLEALSSVSGEEHFAEEARSPLLCRAVEELFIPDNISPEKWLGNWIALHLASPVAMGIAQYPSLTPSARMLIERWWVLPPKREWFHAAYPDVDLWWDMAMKEAIRAQRNGEGDTVASLEHKVFGAFLDDNELEKADEVTVVLLWSRILVDYYRSNVNPRLECES